MPQHMRLPTSTALDIARGQEAVVDVIADTIHPDQQVYGNAELQQLMVAAAEQDADPPTSLSLLDASDAEVMAWMMEGIEGIIPMGSVTDISLDLLEVGPDVDAETLASCAAAGMSIEATLVAPDTSSPQPALDSEAIHLEAGVCTSVDEQAGSGDGVCIDSDKIGEFVNSIQTSKDRITRNVGLAVDTVRDQLIAQNKRISENRELHEQLSTALFQGAADIIGIAIGSMTGQVTKRIVKLLGSDSVSSYVSYILNSVIAGPMKSAISTALLDFPSSEPRETVEYDATLQFFEAFSRGHGDGFYEAETAATAQGLDALVVLDALLLELIAQENRYLSTMRAASLDAFFAVAGLTAGESRTPAEGGDISTEVYSLEVFANPDPRKGIREIRLPEAVPDSLRQEYAANSTLGNRRLLLSTDSFLGDTAKVEYHTGSCDVRGVEARDLCSYREPLLHELVHRMMPERLAEFESLLEDGHLSTHQSHHYRGDFQGSPWGTSDAGMTLRAIEEEAVRRWFLLSIDKLGGTSIPLSQLCPTVLFL